MKKHVVLQICIIAIIMFVAVNYFIKPDRDKLVIDEIIEAAEVEDEDDLVEMRDKHLRSKFKSTCVRAGIFGAAMFMIVSYFVNPVGGSDGSSSNNMDMNIMMPHQGQQQQQQMMMMTGQPGYRPNNGNIGNVPGMTNTSNMYNGVFPEF